MSYAYDRAIALPTIDLYDKQIMAMSINAAKDMYDRGQKRIDDFYEKYGDFVSPILKDMDWYAQNVTGKASNFINQLYANGIDPLRSAEGRAAVAQLVRSMPIGDIAKLRQSAENAKQYNKAMAELQANGLYNPNTERYAGKGMGEFSTINDGIWDRMSPVPYQNMAKFSKDYFDNISPIVRSASKNGISYSIKEINEGDLHNIADRHFNDLVNTPQGQLMYKYYRDITGSDEGARQAFNNAVVSGNLDRLKYEDDYNDNWLKRRELSIKAGELQLKRDRFNWEKEKAAGVETDNPGISLASTWYSKGVANAWSADGFTKNWYDMNKASYGEFGKQALKIFTDFGKTQSGKKRGDMMKAFENKFSIKMDPESVASIIGSPVDGNKMVSKCSDAIIDKLYGVYDTVSNTAGFTKGHSDSTTSKIRNTIRKYGSSNTTISPLGVGYGSLRKNGGNFEVVPKVHIKVVDDNGKTVLDIDAYCNIDLSSATTSGGAYMKDYKESGGFSQIGTPGSHYNAELRRFVPNDVSYSYTSPVSTKDLNMYPDYNQWNGYGVWDTRETSKQLKGKSSAELGTQPFFND